MHTVQTAMGQAALPGSGGRKKQLLMTATLPILICSVTMISGMIRQGGLYYAAPPPQFDALFSVSTLAEAQGIPVHIQQYQVASVTASSTPNSGHCTVTTQDGTRFVVLGTSVARMKPGLIFNARVLPFALHTKQRTAWLEEYSPTMVTDPAKMSFAQVVSLKGSGH